MPSLRASTNAVECYNAALNFALDSCDSGDRTAFLTAWREGDWPLLEREWPEFSGPVPGSRPGSAPAVNVDALANEIRRVDGSNSLGAGALAEALQPFLTRTLEELAS